MLTNKLIFYFNNAKIKMHTIEQIETEDRFSKKPDMSVCEAEIFIAGNLVSIYKTCNGGIQFHYNNSSTGNSIIIENVINYSMENIMPIETENAIDTKLAIYYQIKDIEVISNNIPKDYSQVLHINGNIEGENEILHVVFHEYKNIFHTVHAVANIKLKNYLDSLWGEIIKIKVPYDKRETAYINNDDI